VTVLRHPKEKLSKSSIIPSKIISPDHVEIRHDLSIAPIRLESDPYDSVVLLFPSPDAVDVNSMSREELLAIKRVVLIDSTWHQTKHFLREENLMKLKKVKILTEKTAFWRYQRIAETNLSTIEALYFFFRDFEVGLNCAGDYALYDGRYDNILYYYVYNYWLI
jgi:DTW domain-containing protein YfiP